VFFALSGYLITDLLCTERRRTGRIDLAQFRIRRPDDCPPRWSPSWSP
jgi:peptidoglycan/LPS O-acetylase OafA/YrhL